MGRLKCKVREDPLPKPQPPALLRLQPPPSLPPSPFGSAPPPSSPGLPPGCSRLGCGKDPPPRPAGPSRGHFPSPCFSFLKCYAGRGPGWLYKNLGWGSPAAVPALPPPAGRAPPPLVQLCRRPGTILALSRAPASGVFCNLRLRLFFFFFFFNPQGGAPTGLLLAAGRTAAPVLFLEPLSRVGIQGRQPEPDAGLCAARPALRHGLGPGTPAPATTAATAVAVSCRLGLRSTPGPRSRQPR